MPILKPEHCYFNDHWDKLDAFDPSLFSEGVTLYEVIRVIDGVPLFIEEHLSRLEISAQLISFNLWVRAADLKQIIKILIQKNSTLNGNIKISLNRNQKTDSKNILCQFIPAHYPSKNNYIKGVKSILFNAERDNPNVKKTNQSLREAADKAIKANKIFEVILVDADQHITEGSRSNVFFIKDQTIYTSPNTKVLAGITRQKTLSLCLSNGIRISEQTIKVSELKYFEAAFFSGTSPKILPINTINQIKFNPALPLLRKIMMLYDNEINHYLKSRKLQVKK
jgi:branched-chain amino acid aminotransferase